MKSNSRLWLLITIICGSILSCAVASQSQTSGGGYQIFVSNEKSGDLTVINTGLAEGDRVVTAGQYRVQPGALVQIGTANSEMPPAKPDVAQQDVAQGAQQ